MKKYIFLFLCATFLSCGYSKKENIKMNYASGEVEYFVWVYKDTDLIDGFSCSIDKVDRKKKDSLNKLADELILKCKKYD